MRDFRYIFGLVGYLGDLGGYHSEEQARHACTLLGTWGRRDTSFCMFFFFFPGAFDTPRDPKLTRVEIIP